MAELAIGVDLGGTNVRVALGDKYGRILKRASERTEKNEVEGLIRQITRIILSVVGDKTLLKDARGICVGSAGPLDVKRGALVKPTNLPFDYVPIVKPLEEEFNLPVLLINDCAAAAVGEKYFGAGREHDNLVYVTISTGIGGGVYVDGHLLMGKDGNAHEIGHFTIDFEGRLTCRCGKKGHWEAYCSGTGIPNYAKIIIESEGFARISESPLIKEICRLGYEGISSKTIYDCAKAGDIVAKIVVERASILNAIGFACVVDAYDPSLITVGGSVALNNPDLVINPIRRHIGEHARNRLPEITLTQLGEDAVLYGAIASVFHLKN